MEPERARIHMVAIYPIGTTTSLETEAFPDRYDGSRTLRNDAWVGRIAVKAYVAMEEGE
jgi:hypothetical protein